MLLSVVIREIIIKKKKKIETKSIRSFIIQNNSGMSITEVDLKSKIDKYFVICCLLFNQSKQMVRALKFENIVTLASTSVISLIDPRRRTFPSPTL